MAMLGYLLENVFFKVSSHSVKFLCSIITDYTIIFQFFFNNQRYKMRS